MPVLAVYAKDSGLPPNYARATVRIRVLDENDNPPVFGRLYYSIEVPENLEALPLFTLRATDPDAGDSGDMIYRITGGNYVLMLLSMFLKRSRMTGPEHFIVLFPCSWRSIWRLQLGQTVRRAVHIQAAGSGEEI